MKRFFFMIFVLALPFLSFADDSSLKIIFSSEPELAGIPGTYLYYTKAADFDIFYFQGEWWARSDAGWYKTSNYKDSWVRLDESKLPSSLKNLPENWKKTISNEKKVSWKELKARWDEASGNNKKDAGEKSSAKTVIVEKSAPTIIFKEEPELVVVPGTGVYWTAVGGDDIFFYDGFWWREYHGGWYRSDIYNGSWIVVERSYVPHPVIYLPPRWRVDVFGVHDRVEWHIVHDRWIHDRRMPDPHRRR